MENEKLVYIIRNLVTRIDSGLMLSREFSIWQDLAADAARLEVHVTMLRTQFQRRAKESTDE